VSVPPAPPAPPEAPAAWGLAALQDRLGAARPGLRCEWRGETDSTSTRLLERARGGDTAPALLVAESQTAGRGRLGRPWFGDTAAAGDPPALTFSLGLVLAPADWSGLSLAVGVALAEALGPAVRLKWPNDLWLPGPDGRGRKLGGVLIETLPPPDGGAARPVVVGVGINLDAPAPRPGLDQPVAGWRGQEPGSSAPALLARLAPPLLDALAAFESQGFAAFAARYAARDALRGLRLHTSDPAAPEGEALGVDARGALRLRLPGGEERPIVSGEVSVRPC
jgi:BirA family biotin operon repressor/biotin-[acetyl-CoA-carboxylase] ligase